MLFTNLILPALAVASSYVVTSVFALPSPGLSASKLKTIFQFTREMFAKEIEPHQNLLILNPHIWRCAVFEREECQNLESTLTGELWDVAHNVTSKLTSFLVEYHDRDIVSVTPRSEQPIPAMNTIRFLAFWSFFLDGYTPLRCRNGSCRCR